MGEIIYKAVSLIGREHTLFANFHDSGWATVTFIWQSFILSTGLSESYSVCVK